MPHLAPLMLAGLVAVAAHPAAADEMFAPPEGCRLHMTVQERSCSVSQHYTCAGDAPGDQWTAYFDAEGMASVSRIDKETRWLESTSASTGVTDRLEPKAARHASLSQLLETGRDDFDFWTRSDDGERMHHVGHDELTGERITIDGVALERTRFRLETFGANGDLLVTREGGQYVSRDHARFYGGAETDSDWTGAIESFDNSPVRFVRPGQLGFGSMVPQFGCEAQMVRAPAPTSRDGAITLIRAARADHDHEGV